MIARRCLLIAWIGLLAASSTAAAELIPTPTFSDHVVPTVEVPDAEETVGTLLDVTLLIVALALASWFAIRGRSRRKLLLLSIASLAWFGFYREGCVCSIGAIQNVALAIGDADYAVPLGVLAFFALPLVFTLFFGRTFCASVCPLGAVQEVVAVRSVKVPVWLEHALGVLPFVYLGAAVIFAASGTAFVICRYDPFVAFFRLAGNVDLLIFSFCMVAIGLFVGRPYCRFLCPYGALLGLLSRLSKWHLSIVPSECIQCHLCEDACPYGAIQPPTVPLSTASRQRGRRRLIALLVACPLLVAGLAWLATTWAVPLARWHPRVQLAEQVRLEELKQTTETTDASEAFLSSGQSQSQLYAEAIEIKQRFVRLGGWLGAWIGLVLGCKLLALSVRRQRVDYHPQRSGCVSCGRCFKSCPVELVRLGVIQDVSEMVEEVPA